jgi:hypothetical protein
MVVPQRIVGLLAAARAPAGGEWGLVGSTRRLPPRQAGPLNYCSILGPSSVGGLRAEPITSYLRFSLPDAADVPATKAMSSRSRAARLLA